MYKYNPKAKVREKNGNIRTQYTYDDYTTLTKCIECFNLWSNEYKFDIIDAWIDVTDEEHNEMFRVQMINTWIPKVSYDKFLEELAIQALRDESDPNGGKEYLEDGK